MKQLVIILLLSIIWSATVNAQTSTELFNSGVAKYKSKDYSGALQDLNGSIEKDPGFDRAWHNRGLVKYAMKDWAGAIADQDKAIVLNPTYAMAYNDRGLVRMRQKNYDAASRDLSKAIELDQTLAVAYISRGNIRYELKDEAGAMSDYTRVIALQPGNSNVYFNLGELYNRQSNSSEALRMYKQYVLLEPGELNGYKNIADIYYKQLRDYDSSLYYYDRAFLVNKNEKEVIQNYGYSLLKLGRVKEAMGMFRSQVALLPEDAWGYYNLAAAYSVNKQTNEAIANLNIALEKKMAEHGYWEKDRNLNNIRTTVEFEALVRKWWTPAELKKYPGIFVVMK